MHSSAASGHELQPFEPFRAEVKSLVDTALASWLYPHAAEAHAIGADAASMHDAVASLALRGGKRLRPVLLVAGYLACGGERIEDVSPALVSIELLQAYLLIHDDWMDGDDVRRGGPSAHALLRERFGDERAGDVGAVLAGDYAMALAQRALFDTKLPAERVVKAALSLAKAQSDVCIGQLLDTRRSAAAQLDVEAMHALKTASYTVTAPIAMGAALAGASGDSLAALARYSRPLGVAFQLCDDLLGTFGDPATTGKPRGNDIREGKRTALVVEIERDRDGKRLLDRVLGVADAPDYELEALVARVEASGARGRVEARIAELAKQAGAALDGLALEPRGAALLRGAIVAMTERDQ
jgi:geranylgeranyl diphosphate synthase type I